MTIKSVRDQLRTALSDNKVTADEAKQIVEAAKDETGIDADEKAAILDGLQQPDRFDPEARQALDAGLAGSVDLRASLAGPELNEGLATFDALAAEVAAGKLLPSDQLLLARSTSRLGVLGTAEALGSVKTLEAAPAEEQAALKDLLDAAASPTERAFLFKAVGAGYKAAEVKPFAEAIRGWPEDKLLGTLNLADPILDDGKETGVKQQFGCSCVTTTAQALRGELDPVYALQVRTANPDVNAVDNSDPTKMNPALAAEQKALLEEQGGVAVSRNSGGSGTPWAKIDLVYNKASAHTGFSYSCVQMDKTVPPTTVDAALDAVAGQLQKGIPTPLLVGSAWSPKCHAVIALEVQGAGADQRFLIHDPWVGNTVWCSRAEFEQQKAPIGDCHVIGGYHLASPYVAPPPTQPATTTPPATPTTPNTPPATPTTPDT